MKNIFLHIDVNSAFLSWSAVDLLRQGEKIDIRNIDAVIGHERGRKGIVLAKSVSAKKKGIKTPEPIYMAKRKVPNLKVIKPDYRLYQDMSNSFFDILFEYFSDIEKYSIDEGYIDYTPYISVYGDPIKFAYKLQSEISKRLGFTVNIGIGNSKLCAKMASDLEKPNKVITIFEDEVEKKMWPLPVGDLFMIGKKTAAILYKMDIDTIGNLAEYDSNKLSKIFKNSIGMQNSAKGIDNSKIGRVVVNKGISKSVTFDYDVTSRVIINKIMKEMVSSVGLSLRKQGVYALTVGITVTNNKFVKKNKQKKITNATNVSDEIYKVAIKLLNDVLEEDPIRLIGINVTNFTDNKDVQLSLFENIDDTEKNEKLQEALDSINLKYGINSIVNANLMKKK